MEEEVGEVLEVGVEVEVSLLLLLLLLLLSLFPVEEGGGYVVVALNSLSAISIFNADTDSNLSAVAISISGVAVRFLSLDGTYEGTYTTGRSEERRVGKECLHQCRSRWSPYH